MASEKNCSSPHHMMTAPLMCALWKFTNACIGPACVDVASAEMLLNANKVGRGMKIQKQHLAQYFPSRLHCAEPCSSSSTQKWTKRPGSGGPTGGRKNINLLYYSCTRKTISAIRTQGICACLYMFPLLCISLMSGSLSVSALARKCNFSALIRPKVTECRKKQPLKKWILLKMAQSLSGDEALCTGSDFDLNESLRLFLIGTDESSLSVSVLCVCVYVCFFLLAGHGCCRKCQFF